METLLIKHRVLDHKVDVYDIYRKKYINILCKQITHTFTKK